MRLILALAILATTLPTFAAIAFFTGRQEMVQTVTYQTAWRCEYNFNGRTFWQIHRGSCPYQVEVF